MSQRRERTGPSEYDVNLEGCGGLLDGEIGDQTTRRSGEDTCAECRWDAARCLVRRIGRALCWLLRSACAARAACPGAWGQDRLGPWVVRRLEGVPVPVESTVSTVSALEKR